MIKQKELIFNETLGVGGAFCIDVMGKKMDITNMYPGTTEREV